MGAKNQLHTKFNICINLICEHEVLPVLLFQPLSLGPDGIRSVDITRFES